MAGITEIRDDKVRQLAQTLRSSGLAASEGEAVRMAQSMTMTSSRINQTFENKKDAATMGVSNLKKEYGERDFSGNLWGSQFRKMHGGGGGSQTTHATPTAHSTTSVHSDYAERSNGKEHASDGLMFEDAQDDQDAQDEIVSQEILSSTPEMISHNKEVAVVHTDIREKEMSVAEAVKQEQLMETEVEKTTELPVEPPTKRGTGGNIDPKFSLGSVFKFKG